MKTKKIKKTKAMLEREILELKAQMTCRYTIAHGEINKASIDRMIGSGVLLQLTALGGKEIISPVLIKDGLSDETIEAIKVDLKRSYDLSVIYRI